jgi:hypothetical protein
MRLLALAFATVAATTALGTVAQAQNYPWCAYYSRQGGTNCGFSTFRQCQEDVSGIGGFCERNTQYHSGRAPDRNTSRGY